MKTMKLTDWAAFAEVIGTVGVIVSLIFVAFSIDRNTDEARAEQTNHLYDVSRTIELAVAADQEWSRIIVKGRNGDEPLSDVEKFRYDAYLVSVIDLWDGTLDRYTDDLIRLSQLQDWDDYFEEWASRHVSKNAWERIRWQYVGSLREKIDGLVAASSNDQ